MPTESLRFGRFELQPRERRLLADGAPVALGARAFDLLLAMAARPGQLLTKSELLDAVWPGLVVEEANLSVQVSTLRKVLGGDLIATVPGRGYRFTATLDGVPDRAGATAPGVPAAVHSANATANATATASAATVAAAAPLTNLPAELPTLFGRDTDLVALRDLMDAHRLVTVVGAGGIGKLLQPAIEGKSRHIQDLALPLGEQDLVVGAEQQHTVHRLVGAEHGGLRESGIGPFGVVLDVDVLERLIPPGIIQGDRRRRAAQVGEHQLGAGRRVFGILPVDRARAEPKHDADGRRHRQDQADDRENGGARRTQDRTPAVGGISRRRCVRRLHRH
jgi:DNA-binding winged helix-turn-helix (wHTH) protein